MPAARRGAILAGMVQAPFTYELPVTGSFAENLDDYEARTADGAHVGI